MGIFDDEYANVFSLFVFDHGPAGMVFLGGADRVQHSFCVPHPAAGNEITISPRAGESTSLGRIGERYSVPDIEVSQVGSRRERNAFIKFPWRIYQNDPAWVPPLILERKAFLDRARHPFYEHGDAALFLARRNGEIVGRIMASDDPNYNSLHRSSVGCFGLFDCVDDVDLARVLFEAAADWLRQKGRSEIMGPIDYSTNYVCGLLIDGFEHSPTLLTAHNPPYYARLIEACGFAKEKDWYAWWLSLIHI